MNKELKLLLLMKLNYLKCDEDRTLNGTADILDTNNGVDDKIISSKWKLEKKTYNFGWIIQTNL